MSHTERVRRVKDAWIDAMCWRFYFDQWMPFVESCPALIQLEGAPS